SKFELIEDEFHYVSEEKADSLGRAVATRGDIIVTHRGTIGQISYIPMTSKYPRYLTGNSQFRFTCNSLVLPQYIVYYFHTPIGRHELLSNASQVGVPALARPTTSFQKLTVHIPELDDQKRVVKIIGGIEKRIKSNNAINDNLLLQAQALYTDTFITKANPSWIPGRLADLIIVRYGKDHKKLADGRYPVYGSGGIMRYVERPLYEKESVLIPRKGTLNNVMYVNEPFWSVDTMFYTEMRTPCIAKFVFHFVKSKDLASMNAGSAVPSMTTDILNALELPIPDNETLERFEQSVAPMYWMIQANNRESTKLGQLRDSILPKLMSGEIDVSNITL
ncbi:MAG: restriction endonuclease subunit S, partial [Bacteroidaceae bacterium]|nr:restriction endonuclease subunit S [Bacteroidaceae bacterium]